MPLRARTPRAWISDVHYLAWGVPGRDPLSLRSDPRRMSPPRFSVLARAACLCEAPATRSRIMPLYISPSDANASRSVK